jgi:anti-sigma regulatory factor (Ser/Thr protein kinase)
MSDMNRTLELTLPATAEAPSLARNAFWRSLPGEQHPSVRSADAELLVSELVTNCVLHADPPAGGDPISFVLGVDSERVRVEVSDAGKGFMAPTSKGGPRDAGSGWGLRLVDQLADDLGVDRSPKGGSTVWFEMHL